jgi:hypothetical protein
LLALVRSCKMENITEIIEPMTEAVIVVIDNGDGTFTSMLKSTYDEMIAQQGQHLTENPTEGENN